LDSPHRQNSLPLGIKAPNRIPLRIGASHERSSPNLAPAMEKKSSKIILFRRLTLSSNMQMVTIHFGGCRIASIQFYSIFLLTNDPKDYNGLVKPFTQFTIGPKGERSHAFLQME
jgi:hypothetical protein